MYMTITPSLLSVVFIASSLLIASSFENAVIKVQQAVAQNSNNSDGILKVGPPHHNPQLPISDRSILGPILGTQAQ
jgi:hypothetical protein